MKNIYETELPFRAKAVYEYLCKRAGKERTCFPGMKRIASDLSLSRKTVQRAVNDLEQAGLVYTEQRWRENGGRSTLMYYIL